MDMLSGKRMTGDSPLSFVFCIIRMFFELPCDIKRSAGMYRVCPSETRVRKPRGIVSLKATGWRRRGRCKIDR